MRTLSGSCNGQWHMYTLTVDMNPNATSLVRTYGDSLSVITGGVNYIPGNFDKLYLGQGPDGTFAEGQLSGFNTWNRQLTTEEINELYSAGPSLATIPFEDCYQETATESTACGGLTGGSYDGLLGTDGDYRRIEITYKKPSGITNALWQIKHAELDAYNVTVPEECMGVSSTELKLGMISNGGGWNPSASWGECWDGYDWRIITQKITSHQTGSWNNPDNGVSAIDGDWDTHSSWSDFGWVSKAALPITRWFEEGIYWTDADLPPPIDGGINRITDLDLTGLHELLPGQSIEEEFNIDVSNLYGGRQAHLTFELSGSALGETKSNYYVFTFIKE